MTREQVVEGVKWLCNSLYRPEAFEERVAQGDRDVRQPARRASGPGRRAVGHARHQYRLATLIRKIAQLGPAEKKMMGNVVRDVPARIPLPRPTSWGICSSTRRPATCMSSGSSGSRCCPARLPRRSRRRGRPSGLPSRPDADTRIVRGSLSQPPDALQQLRVPARLSSCGAHHLCARRSVSARPDAGAARAVAGVLRLLGRALPAAADRVDPGELARGEMLTSRPSAAASSRRRSSRTSRRSASSST